ncbi:MAG: hypothetical protein J6Y00_00525 [Paludibacteraceae bacterium]|nr:hypothetical protein [Paludibacteraceae bacterium]
MKTEQEIRLAVCAKFLKQELQALEVSLREQEKDAARHSHRLLRPELSEKENDNNHQTKQPTMKKKSLIFVSLAAAACCALVIGLHINQASWADRAFQQGISSTEIFVSRGDNKVDNELQNAYQLMFDGRFKESDRVLKELTGIISKSKPESDEEAQILKVQRDEQQWLHALSLLGQGKYRKARKQLRQIANENGTFALQAEQLLQQKQ